MGLVDRLKKKLEGAAAQVNPFDGGQTYSSVVRTPFPTAAQPAAVTMPHPTQAAPTLSVSRPTPTPSIHVSSPKPLQGLSVQDNGVRIPLPKQQSQPNLGARVVNQLNPFDNGRTFKQTTPTNNRSVVGQVTHNGTTNVVGDWGVKPLVINPVATAVVEPTRNLIAQATDNRAAEATSDLREQQNLRESIPGQVVNLATNVGKTLYNTPQAVIADVHGFRHGSAGEPTVNEKRALDSGFKAFNETPIGQLTRPAQYAADKIIPTAAEASATAGYNSNEPLAQTFIADPISGVASVAALGKGKDGATPVVKTAVDATTHTLQAVRDLPRQLKDNTLKTATNDTPIQSVPTSRLISYEGAPDAARVQYYKDQIAAGQHPDPIIAMTDSTGRLGVEDGKHKLQAYRELGIKNVPTKIMTPDDIKKISQGGYVRLPGGERAPAPDLSPEQASFVNDYAEMLEGMDAGTTGGDIVPGAEGSVRTSGHSPFYRDYYTQNRKPPTKQDWFNEARRQIEGGKAAYGASEEYAKLSPSSDIQPGQQLETSPTDTPILNSDAVESQLPNRQEISSPTNIAPETQDLQPNSTAEPAPVEHRIEDEAANRAAIRNSDLDRAVQEDLGRAGSRTGDIVQAHAERSGLPTQEAAKDVWRIAEQSGYDIRDGVPYRVQPDATPLSRTERGAQTEQSDLDALNAATDQLKVGASKGLIGVEHAVTLKETPHQKLNAYVDKNGDIKTYIEQKRADGNWHEILNSHAPIKNADDSRGVLKLLGDPQIQEEVNRASNDGITRQYIWTEDANGTSSGLRTHGRKDPVTPTTMQFDPETQTVAGGFIRDKETGEILGNYVAVGPNGIQVQIGRQFITIPLDASKLSDAKGGNNSFNQAERWIEAVTKDEPTREQLRNLVVYPTREAEANLKVEANALGQGIRSWRKALVRTVSPAKRKGMMRDAVYVIEPDSSVVRQLGSVEAKKQALEAFTNTYGGKAADVLSQYDEWVRSVYDNLLERQNAVRRHNGLDEIPKRQDYLTHTQELNGGLGQLYQDLHDGIFGEVEGGSVRGKLPAQIAGRTENFKPIQKYNPFAKQRSGDGKPLNPFDPVSTYAGVALHNIHLTKPAAIVRSLETALRAAQEFATNKPEGLTGAAAERYDALAKRFGGNYGDAVEWLTEHANILSGKSSNFNRLVLKSSGGRKALNVLKFMQRQTGRANIIGNVSSVLSQTLNLPSTLGTNGIRSTISGIARSLGGPADNAAWRKSNFLKERYVDGSVLRNKNVLEKALKPFGVPLGLVERAFVHIAWNSSYDKALARGFKGDAAIRAADSTTSKIVSGRSIGDTPHVYNNLLGSTVLQFTREQTEAWKNFTKDQSAYGKALTLVAAAGMNHLVQNLTGRAPLPDPLTASIQTVNDFRNANNNDDNQDKSIVAKTGRAAQRLATTVVSAVPAASAVANELPQDARKTVFGSDSDLGRYEGTVAVTGPVTNIIDSAKAAADHHYTTAAQDAIAVLPGGGQVRKTWQGLQTAANGVTDKNGVVTTEVDPSTSNYIRAGLFGKNAIPEVQQSYQSNDSVASNGSLGDAIRSNDKQQKRLQVELQKSLSPEENDLRGLSADERATLINEGTVTTDQLTDVDRKVLAAKKRLGIVPGVGGQTIPKLAKGVPQGIKDFYKDRAYVTDADLPDWQNKQADGGAKDLIDTANQIRPDGSPELPQTNRVAELYANFVKQRADSKWGKEKENIEKGKFLTAAYKSTLSPQQQEWYGLSDTQVQQAIDDGEIGGPDLSELIDFDDHMRGVGLPGEIGNTLRENYGFQTWTAPGAKPKKAKQFSAPPGFFSNASTIGQFRKLIANAKL